MEVQCHIRNSSKRCPLYQNWIQPEHDWMNQFIRKMMRPSHLVFLHCSPSRGMMGPAIWRRLRPGRWGWRGRLVFLHLLQHHNAHTASPLWPHQEQTFTHTYSQFHRFFQITYVQHLGTWSKKENKKSKQDRCPWTNRYPSSCKIQSEIQLHPLPVSAVWLCDSPIILPFFFGFYDSSLLLPLTHTACKQQKPRQQGIPLRNGVGKQHAAEWACAA